MPSPTLVTLILDGAQPGGGSPLPALTAGYAEFIPNSQLVAPAYQGAGWVPPAAIQAQFRSTGPPSVELLPTDDTNVSPSGWQWKVTFYGVAGNPVSFYFLLPLAGAPIIGGQPTRYLSQIASVSPVTPGQSFMPVPSGTATSGYVPVATGIGEASTWTPVSGTGTVTSVSVVSSNGFAGSVANPTTTPAVTVSTSVTGLLKGNGTAVSAATAGTDYVTPTGSGATLTGITASQVGALPSSDDLSAIATANATAASVPMNNHKFTGLANGSASSDSAAFGQIPTSAGSIGGLLAANNLSDVGTRQTAMDNLAGAVTSGQVLRGNGTHVTLAALQSGDIPNNAASTSGNAATATNLAGTAATNSVYAGPSSGGAAAPAFRALAASDIPQLADYAPTGLTGATAASRYAGATASGAPASGTFAVGDYVVDQTGKIWVCTTAGTPGTWTQAGGPAAQPWQFPVSSYGAKGDCEVIGDGAMASTSSGVLTSATGLFASGDVGKTILVAGAGTASGRQTLVTTIASYQSATQVTLSANPAAVVSGAWCIWGTDDTAAINSAVSAAYTYWQNNSYRQPEILMPSIYMLAGAPTQGGTRGGNAQIPLPAPAMSGAKFEPKFTGQPFTPSAMYGVNSTPFVTGGTVVCGRTDGTLNATYGPASVFGTWTYQQGARDAAMANLRPIFDGISVILPYTSTYTAFDLYGATGADLYVGVIPWATPAQIANPNAGDFIGKTWAVGVRTPTQANDGDTKIRNIAAAGVFAGLQIGEHVQVDSGIILYCYNGIYAYSDSQGSSASHSSRIGYICVEACYYNLAFLESSKLDIDVIDMDSGAGGSGFQVLDTGNAGRGQVTVRGLGATEGRPSVSGGALMRIINGDQVPGTAGISQPAVPATTVAFKNDFYRDALVCVSGGTVSAIAIADSGGGNSLTLGITSGPIVVASGKQVTLTYSATPTWTWTLL